MLEHDRWAARAKEIRKFEKLEAVEVLVVC